MDATEARNTKSYQWGLEEVRRTFGLAEVEKGERGGERRHERDSWNRFAYTDDPTMICVVRERVGSAESRKRRRAIPGRNTTTPFAASSHLRFGVS